VAFNYARSKEKLDKLARDADALLLALHWSRIDDVLKQAGELAYRFDRFGK